MRCETVPQGVRTKCDVKAGHFEILVHLPADTSCAKTRSKLVDKQDLRIEIAVAGGTFVPELEILLDCLQSGGADRSDSFLFALAADVEDFAEEVNIVEIESDKLTYSYAGAVKGFENGPVPCTEPVVEGRGFEEFLYLVAFEKAGESFILFRRSDRQDGIVGELTSFNEEFVEAPQGGYLSSYGSLGVLLRIKKSQV